MKLYVKKYLDKDIQGLTYHQANKLLAQAEYMHELEITTMATAIAKALGGTK